MKNRIRIIIQARTTSSRLPAKVHLPVGNMPLAVLVAKRAARNGADVVVATSSDVEDDLLHKSLTENGIEVFRGGLNNVMQRFVDALRDLSDEDICIRLTADNPFPDADFLDEIMSVFISNSKRYLAYGNSGQWVPYGLSAEVFYVGDLREANRNNPSPFELEHVTTSLRQNHEYWDWPVLDYFDENLGSLRCTIDRLEDYLKVASIFEKFDNPVNVSWKKLVAELSTIGSKKNVDLVLGTVQLGTPYGVNKSLPLMSSQQAEDILNAAKHLNINCLDTARAYEESEKRVGIFLNSQAEYTPNVITKLSPLASINNATGSKQIHNLVRESILTSIEQLSFDQLPVLMLHRANHMTSAGGEIWNAVLSAQKEGLIKRLGVSIQSPEELSLALGQKEIKYIQMPYNILEWRFDHLIPKIIERNDVIIHVRSIFLQGILLQSDSSYWPQIDGVDQNELIKKIHTLTAALKRDDPLDLSLSYVRSMSWIDGIVVGVDCPEQLLSISENWKNEPLEWSQANLVRSTLLQSPETLLNPALWKSKQ